jgi:hypothetical protein
MSIMKPAPRGPKTIAEAPARARPSVLRQDVGAPSEDEVPRRPHVSLNALAREDKLSVALDAGGLRDAAKGGLAMGDPTTFEDIDEPGDGFIDNPDFCGTDTGGESELTLGDRTSPLAAQGIRFRPIRSVALSAPGGGSSTPRSIPAVARRVVEPAVPLTGPAVRIANGRLSVVAARRSTWRSVIKREWFELADAEEFLDVETLTSTTARTGSGPRGARRQEHGQSFWNAHDEHLIDLDPEAVRRRAEAQSFAGPPMVIGTGGGAQRLWNLGVVPYCFSQELRDPPKDSPEYGVVQPLQVAIDKVNLCLGPALTFVQMPRDEWPDDPVQYERPAGPFVVFAVGKTAAGQSSNDGPTGRLFTNSADYRGPVIIWLNPEDGSIVSTAVHEIGHLIGLNHQNKRPDNQRWYRVRTDEASLELVAFEDTSDPTLSVPRNWGNGEPDASIPILDSVDYISRMTYDEIRDNTVPAAEARWRARLHDIAGNQIRSSLQARQPVFFSSGDVSRLQQMYHHMRHPDWSLFTTLALPLSPDANAQFRPLSPYLAPGVAIGQSPAIGSGLDGVVLVAVGTDRRLYVRWVEPVDDRAWMPLADDVISPAALATDDEGTIHLALWRQGDGAPRWRTLQRGARAQWLSMADSVLLRGAVTQRAPVLATNSAGLVECAVAVNSGGSTSYVFANLPGGRGSWGAASVQFNCELASAARRLGPGIRPNIVVVQRPNFDGPLLEILDGESFGDLEIAASDADRRLWPGVTPIVSEGQTPGGMCGVVAASRAYGVDAGEKKGDFPILWRLGKYQWEPLGGLPDVRFDVAACRRYSNTHSESGGYVAFVERPVLDAGGGSLLPGGIWLCTHV